MMELDPAKAAIAPPATESFNPYEGLEDDGTIEVIRLIAQIISFNPYEGLEDDGTITRFFNGAKPFVSIPMRG